MADLNISLDTIRILEENTGSNLFDISLGDDFFGFDTKNKGKKSKSEQVGLHQTTKLLHSSGNHQRNEKANY